jgi:universal stress protein E
MSGTKLVIVAGVGDLVANDPALLAAVELARGAGAELHLVRAYDLPPALEATSGFSLGLAGRTQEYREQLSDELRAAAGEGDAACHVRHGSPGACLLQVAKEVGAGLLVVGAARRARLRRMVLGTTAQRVLRESPVPVLVVRRPVARPLGRVLLTGDLSELSGAVQDAALPLVERLFGAPAAARSLFVVPWSLTPPPLEESAVEQAARDELDEFLCVRSERGYPVEAEVRMGEPAEEIVAEAGSWNADLVVVGTHARGWGARLLLGSVAEATLRDAPCNVLAVPPRRTRVESEPDPTCVESGDLSLWAEAAGVP